MNFLFKYKQFLNVIFLGLLNNKLRSFLTMLGIIIGVAAVVVIMSLGSGAQSLILDQVKSLGSNVIGILPGKSEKNGPPAAAMGIVVTTLTYKDAINLKNTVDGIIDVVAYSKGIATVSKNNINLDTNISGTTTGHLVVEEGKVAKGRFFSENEERNLARVAVLGSEIKKDLFGSDNAIGKKIKIKRLSFEVIGVMEERGTVLFQNYDDQIFVPISTMQRLILGVHHIGLLRMKTDKKKDVNIIISDVEERLRERHGITDKSGDNDDFSVRSSEEALEMISVITDSLNLFLAAMAAISLVVGGVGIMNIMLISVNERTREIGLRKAVGAKSINILNQFLTESVFLTLIGGLIGIVLGVLFSYLISVGINFLGYNWSFIVSFFSVFLSIFITALVGIVFGLYPAKKASKLSPMEALRYE